MATYCINAMYDFDRSFTPLGEIEFVSRSLGSDIRSDAAYPGSNLKPRNVETSPETTTLVPVNRFSGTWAGKIPVPLPICYLQGIDLQKRDFETPLRSFLMGEWRYGGWWYYYLIGIVVKEPLAVLVLAFIAAGRVVWDWIPRWTASRETAQPQQSGGTAFRVCEPDLQTMNQHHMIREDLLLLIPAILVIALVSSQTNMNHHFRYILPAYPFAYVFISRVATLSRISAFRWLIQCLAVWQIGAVLWFAPHWLSYFNEFAGGPANGHRWLLGSSLEWGQDLLSLKQWQDQHPEVDPLHVAVVSQYDPASLGLTYESPPPFISGRPSVRNLKGDRGPKAGWFAISVNILKGTAARVYDSDGGQISVSGHFQYFDNFEPVDMIGYSIYIYHITEEDAARVRAKLLAEEAEWLRKAESGERKAEGGA